MHGEPTISDLLALAQEIADTEHISHDAAYQQAQQEYSSLQQEYSDATIRIQPTLFISPTCFGLVLCRNGRRVVVGRDEIPTLIRILEETYNG